MARDWVSLSKGKVELKNWTTSLGLDLSWDDGDGCWIRSKWARRNWRRWKVTEAQRPREVRL